MRLIELTSIAGHKLLYHPDQLCRVQAVAHRPALAPLGGEAGQEEQQACTQVTTRSEGTVMVEETMEQIGFLFEEATLMITGTIGKVGP